MGGGGRDSTVGTSFLMDILNIVKHGKSCITETMYM